MPESHKAPALSRLCGIFLASASIYLSTEWCLNRVLELSKGCLAVVWWVSELHVVWMMLGGYLIVRVSVIIITG